MAIYALGDLIPDIDPTVFVHPDATVIGQVRLGPRASVWAQAVLRGDYGAIRIGAASNVQDGAVIHATAEHDTVIGDSVVIGHLAHIEGAIVEDRALIGAGSIVLHDAVVGVGATVGAGAVVAHGTQVPASALAVGVPAVVKANRSHPDVIEIIAQTYLDNAERYAKELRRLD